MNRMNAALQLALWARKIQCAEFTTETLRHAGRFMSTCEMELVIRLLLFESLTAKGERGTKSRTPPFNNPVFFFDRHFAGRHESRMRSVSRASVVNSLLNFQRH